MQHRWLGLFVGGIVMVAACGGDGGGAPPKCIPGQSVACVGPGACDGNQICRADGTFGACMCGGSGTGGSSGNTGSRGGAGGSGGAAGLVGITGTAGAAGSAGAAGTAGAAGAAGTGGGAGVGGSAAGAGGRGGAAGGAAGTGGGAAGTGGRGGAAGGGTGGSAAGTGGRGGTGGGAGAAGSGTAGTGAGGTAGSGGAGGAGVCNPIAQTGCPTSQRCAWVVTGPDTGHGACLADGSVNLGGACSYGPAGETTGFDNCRKGTACINGLCKTICNGVAVPDGCPTNYSCVLYASAPFNLDGNGDIGFCDPGCDPLTQVRADGAAACGSANPSAPNLGCFGTPGGKFSCGPIVSTTKTHGAAAGTPVYANSCAPGYEPLLFSMTGSTTVICVALCKPASSSSASPGAAVGEAGSGHTCPDKGAGSTAECRYWWTLENITAGLSSYSNTLGYCIDYANYRYDSDGNGSADRAWPSCTTLSPTAHTYDSVLTDAQAWGCASHP